MVPLYRCSNGGPEKLSHLTCTTIKRPSRMQTQILVLQASILQRLLRGSHEHMLEGNQEGPPVQLKQKAGVTSNWDQAGKSAGAARAHIMRFCSLGKVEPREVNRWYCRTVNLVDVLRMGSRPGHPRRRQST